LSRKRRALYLATTVFVLATAAWASTQLVAAGDDGEPGLAPAFAAGTAEANELKAPLPPPVEVLVRKRSNSDGLGNVFVLARLRAEDLDAKQAEGTRDFVTIGNPDNQVILRDDGRGGDDTAGDGLFTGIADVDEKDLADKESEERAELSSRTAQQVPVFEGRSASRVETPQAFDLAGFDAGATVPLKPAVAFVDPESVSAQPVEEALISSKAGASTKISSAAPVVLGTNQFQERVLMIRSAAVVQDLNRTWNPCTGAGNANGVWTFNHVMTEMANQNASGIDASDLVERWLDNWGVNQTINGDAVPARLEMQNTILGQWPRLPNGKLDLAQSPLRLLAIVPRLDLRTTTGGGGAYAVNTSGNFLDAGEARFVFGFVIPGDWKAGNLILLPPIPNTNGCRPTLFTVIVEFRVPKCECEEVRAWARQWVALKDFVPGTAAYNSRLERITQQFVRANANPARPNGSALGQLRTNEVTLNPPPENGTIPWELREFQLTQMPFTFLVETTVADTPADAHNNTNLLRSWILTIRQQLPLANLEAPIRPVPLLFGSGTNFLGGKSQVKPEPNPGAITFFWNAPNLNLADTRTNWARHRVSRAACSGCHRREVFTPFLHVSSATPNPPADISVFLSGINGLGDPADALANGLPVSNPANGNPKRNFDDLARRELDVKKVARMKCFHFRTINLAAVNDSLVSSGKLPDDLFAGAPEHGHASVAAEDMTQNHISEVH
jgi:hypothetical protein